MAKTEPRPEPSIIQKLGLPTKTGTVKLSKGRYVLALGRTQKPIPAGLLAEADLKKLVNKKVIAAVSNGTVVLIVRADDPIPLGEFVCFICYVAPPDFYKRIDPEFQRVLVSKYVDLKVLTEAQGKLLSEVIR